jgi:uncharacterized protein (DUF427 family)
MVTTLAPHGLLYQALRDGGITGRSAALDRWSETPLKEQAGPVVREPRIPGPDHPITITPHPSRIVVRAGGEVLADTTSALTLREAAYPPVYYLPLADVDQDALKRTDTSTYCPYKGDCSYFGIPAADGSGDTVDVAWFYEEPYPAVAEIASRVAFYADRVTVVVEGETSAD